jgi:trimeric autotransporter adhesin
MRCTEKTSRFARSAAFPLLAALLAGAVTASLAIPPASADKGRVVTSMGTTLKTAIPTAGRGAGSVPVGTAAYAAPSSGLFVSNKGSNANTGTISRPLKTVAYAVAKAASGRTIVLRGGSYHEKLLIPANKRLTIQSYPREAVWFDGARKLTGWVKSGATWQTTSSVKLDSSPTYTRGAPDNTTPGWNFINPDYPMAAHPDQIFIGSTQLLQVEYRSQVAAGKFFADYANERIVIGSSPAGRNVVGSSLTQAMLVMAKGTVLRGFGVRNYAPSVPDFGAIVVRGPGSTLENVVIANSSTIGLAVSAIGCTLRKVTVVRSGMLGIGSNYSDGLMLDRVHSQANNREHFNFAPVSGGIKVTRTRGVTVKGSESSYNYGTGMWFDESVYNAKVLNSNMRGNKRYGLIFEISAVVTIANNLITDSAKNGIGIANTSDVRIWNNTIVRSKRAINVTQDKRLQTQTKTPGHDPRRPNPDPTMSWISRNITVRNNVLALGGTTPNALFGLEDLTNSHDASYFNVTLNGDVYNRTEISSPRWTHVWTKAYTHPSVFNTAEAFTTASKQDVSKTVVDGRAALNSTMLLGSAVAQVADPRATALPSDLAAMTGQKSGAKHAGVWR